MRRFKKLTIVSIFFLQSLSLFAQDININLGPDEIALNEAFTITVTIEGETLKSYDQFPDIPGFRKRGTSSSTSTNIFNGQVTRSQSVTQTYSAERQGQFKLAPFTITVNGKPISSPGKVITVGPARQQQRNRRYDPFGNDPFEEFFGRRDKPTEFVDIKEDAFFALTTDKDEIYAGEGVNATLAFYVAEANRAPLQFYDLSNQLNSIVKEIKPSNVWEENFNIENIRSETVVINGKRYSAYKIYQATFFPLSSEDIEFSPVGLKMLKYKVAKDPSFFGQSRKEDYKTFYTKPKKVKVKDLPNHPLKESVAVGDFSLTERLDREELKTGESFQYEFQVNGVGNIASINPPSVKENKAIELYPPNTQENIMRSGTTVKGRKQFNFYGIPKEPGTYELADLFQFIYFNTKSERYDTLKSKAIINVVGESMKNKSIASSSSSSLFYDIIEGQNNELRRMRDLDWLKVVFNILLVIAFGFSLFILLKKS